MSNKGIKNCIVTQNEKELKKKTYFLYNCDLYALLINNFDKSAYGYFVIKKTTGKNSQSKRNCLFRVSNCNERNERVINCKKFMFN